MSVPGNTPTRKPRLLVGVTGSVAAVKWETLCCALQPFFDLRVILTEHAGRFQPEAYAAEAHAAWEGLLASQGSSLGSASSGGSSSSSSASTTTGSDLGLSGLPPAGTPLAVLRDADEWRGYSRVGQDPVVHIELRKWADGLVVAPCSANSLAKLAGGLADNLLTCTARAWEFGEGGRVLKPLLLAPAMNTAMWAHPVTATHLAVLAGWGCTLLPPVDKVLACGDRGVGAMALVQDIVAACRAAVLAPPGAAAGRGEAQAPEEGVE
jgi:phosphopantothenoylcysteine decarboxylase